MSSPGYVQVRWNPTRLQLHSRHRKDRKLPVLAHHHPGTSRWCRSRWVVALPVAPPHLRPLRRLPQKRPPHHLLPRPPQFPPSGYGTRSGKLTCRPRPVVLAASHGTTPTRIPSAVRKTRLMCSGSWTRTWTSSGPSRLRRDRAARTPHWMGTSTPWTSCGMSSPPTSVWVHVSRSRSRRPSPRRGRQRLAGATLTRSRSVGSPSLAPARKPRHLRVRWRSHVVTLTRSRSGSSLSVAR